MQESENNHWFRAELLFSIPYIITGIIFAAIVNSSSSAGSSNLWKWIAFIISVIIFAMNITYEHHRMQNPPRSTALHVSSSVAVAAFILAILAYLQGLITNAIGHNMMLYALFIWPFITGIPAFLVSLAVATFLSRKKMEAEEKEDEEDENGNIEM